MEKKEEKNVHNPFKPADSSFEMLNYNNKLACTFVLSGSPVTLRDALTVMRQLVFFSIFNSFSTFTQNPFKHLKKKITYIRTGHC